MDFSTFHLFSSLPTELRLKVWEYNLPNLRIIPLNYNNLTTTANGPSTHGCTSPSPVPANLHTNREARTHALRFYTLSFALPHCAPKVFFNPRADLLYFPVKEGWLGSWNHFVNAVSMVSSKELSRVRGLAVHESLFKGLQGKRQSENVQDTCMREFWDYVRRKFVGVKEVVVLCERSGVSGSKDEEVRVWMEGVLGCVVGKDGIWVGSEKERLVDGLERGLIAVQEEKDWVAPKLEVLNMPENDDWSEGVGSPIEVLAAKSRSDRKVLKRKFLDKIVIPHSDGSAKKRQGFWMGGQLPRWHYLGEVDGGIA